MKKYKLMPGIYEYWENEKMKYRIYKNRWQGWTVAIFSEKYLQFIDSRYFKTLKQAENAILLKGV